MEKKVRVATATPTRRRTDFPEFDRLAPMLPPVCREQVRQTMQLLKDEWRDDLCKATIVMMTKGRRKPYRRSRVMRTMMGRVAVIIGTGNNGKTGQS